MKRLLPILLLLTCSACDHKATVPGSAPGFHWIVSSTTHTQFSLVCTDGKIIGHIDNFGDTGWLSFSDYSKKVGRIFAHSYETQDEARSALQAFAGNNDLCTEDP